MPQLTRRRDPEARHQSWQVFYGDVRAGWIGERAGVPHDEEHWGWAYGFYPGSEPRECASDAAATFDEARAGFMRDWDVFLAKRTPADFDEWRYQQAHAAWKYAMRDAGCMMPTQMPDGRSRCFCGMIIDAATVDRHVFAAHMAFPRLAVRLGSRHTGLGGWGLVRCENGCSWCC